MREHRQHAPSSKSNIWLKPSFEPYNNDNNNERDFVLVPAGVHSTAKVEGGLITKYVHCQLVHFNRCSPISHFN